MARKTCKFCGELLPQYHKSFCNNQCKKDYSKNNRFRKPCDRCGLIFKPFGKGKQKICKSCKDKSIALGINKMRKENRKNKKYSPTRIINKLKLEKLNA